MEIETQTLSRLSHLELRQYAGELNAIAGEDTRLFGSLLSSPVEVTVAAEKGICDDRFYEICLKSQGKYGKFVDVRHKVTQDLSAQSTNPNCWNLLTVLFDGVYVGDPEDVLYWRENQKKKILFPIQGLGKKVAEVKFV